MGQLLFAVQDVIRLGREIHERLQGSTGSLLKIREGIEQTLNDPALLLIVKHSEDFVTACKKLPEKESQKDSLDPFSPKSFDRWDKPIFLKERGEMLVHLFNQDEILAEASVVFSDPILDKIGLIITMEDLKSELPLWEKFPLPECKRVNDYRERGHDPEVIWAMYLQDIIKSHLPSGGYYEKTEPLTWGTPISDRLNYYHDSEIAEQFIRAVRQIENTKQPYQGSEIRSILDAFSTEFPDISQQWGKSIVRKFRWPDEEKPSDPPDTTHADERKKYLPLTALTNLNNRFFDQVEFRIRAASRLINKTAVLPEESRGTEILIEGFENNSLKVKDKVIPITIEIQDGFNAAAFSGRNNDGKSSALQTEVSAIFWGATGFSLPCKSARLPLPRKILFVGPETEHVEIGHGYLERQIKRFATILKDLEKDTEKKFPKALVVIDEAPLGGSPEELVALTLAFKEELVRQGALVMMTTHLQPLLTLLEESGDTQMKLVGNPSGSAKENKEYQVRDGRATRSEAIELAASLGFPQEVVTQAWKLFCGEDKPPFAVAKPNKQALSSEKDIKSGVWQAIENIYGRAKYVLSDFTSSHIPEILDSDEFTADPHGRIRLFNSIFDQCQLDKAPFGEDSCRFYSFHRHRDMDVIEPYKQASERFIERGNKWLQSSHIEAQKLRAYLGASPHAACLERLENMEACYRKVEEGLSKLTSNESEIESQQVAEIEASYNEIKKNFRWFDCYIGMARCSLRNAMLLPSLVSEQNFLTFEDLRPINYTRISRNSTGFIPSAVPITYPLTGDESAIIIVGPNSSGKSFSMDQVALISEMARRGIPIPGKMAISDSGNIYGRFKSRLQDSKASYFTNALQDLLAIANAMPGDTVYIDEIHGTEPRELSAIQAALIDHLRARRIKVIVNSHVREHFDSYIEDPTVAVLRPDVTRKENGDMEPHYTFSKTNDITPEYFGFAIARRHLPGHIADRAEEIFALFNN